MDIQSCLIKLGYKAVVLGDSYEGIKPHELETRPIPSLEELEAVWPDVQMEMEKDRTKTEAKALLNEIDLKSIRSIREWIALQPEAPQRTKDYEAQAISARTKLT